MKGHVEGVVQREVLRVGEIEAALHLLQSDGTPWRPLVHIEDISRAFLAVLEGRPPLTPIRR